jgi:PEP-CTERM motif
MRHRVVMWLAGLAVAGVPLASPAASIPFTATLSLRVSTLEPMSVSGSGLAVVNGSGGPGALTSLALPSAAIQTTGRVFPITDPAAAPVQGIQLTLHNASGSFSAGGGELAGVMPLSGFARVCLFAACPGVASLTLPLAPVGQGGTATHAGTNPATPVTVQGAPWTTGPVVASVPVLTLMTTGFVHGPSSGTASAGEPGGAVRLVTPITIRTSIAGDAQLLPGLATLDVHFVPEPTTLALLLAALAALAATARRRSPTFLRAVSRRRPESTGLGPGPEPR